MKQKGLGRCPHNAGICVEGPENGVMEQMRVRIGLKCGEDEFFSSEPYQMPERYKRAAEAGITGAMKKSD